MLIIRVGLTKCSCKNVIRLTGSLLSFTFPTEPFLSHNYSVSQCYPEYFILFISIHVSYHFPFLIIGQAFHVPRKINSSHFVALYLLSSSSSSSHFSLYLLLSKWFNCILSQPKHDSLSYHSTALFRKYSKTHLLRLLLIINHPQHHVVALYSSLDNLSPAGQILTITILYVQIESLFALQDDWQTG